MKHQMPRIVIEPPGPKAKDQLKKSHEYLTAPDARGFPGTILTDGYGAMVKDVDGNVYLDFSMIEPTIGRAHPKHIQAIKRQLDKLIYNSLAGALHESYLEFAKVLKRIIPRGLGDARFINCTTGTEACDVGINLARMHTGRSIVLAYHDSYHGKTGGTVGFSTSLSQVRKHSIPLISETAYLPFPDCFRCPFGHEYPSCHLVCLKYVETVLETETPPERVAAIIIEPVQAHGGVRSPINEYFLGLRELCRQHGILLVVDEVYTGFGKTGKFFAIEHWLDDPDVLCLGKAMGGGMPIAAVVADKEIIASTPFQNDSMGAFAAHTVSSAAAVATIQIIKEEKLLEHVTKMGDYFRRALRSLSADHDMIGDIRGKGIMIGVEFVKDRETKTPALGQAKKVTLAAFKKGLLCITRGRYQQVLEMTPPLNVTPEQIDAAIEILDIALKETTH